MIEQSDQLIGSVIRSMAMLYRTHHSYTIKELPFSLPDIEFSIAWHQRYDNDLGHQWLREKLIEIGSLL